MSLLFESKDVGKGSFPVRWNQTQDPYGHILNFLLNPSVYIQIYTYL